MYIQDRINTTQWRSWPDFGQRHVTITHRVVCIRPSFIELMQTKQKPFHTWFDLLFSFNSILSNRNDTLWKLNKGCNSTKSIQSQCNRKATKYAITFFQFKKTLFRPSVLFPNNKTNPFLSNEALTSNQTNFLHFYLLWYSGIAVLIASTNCKCSRACFTHFILTITYVKQLREKWKYFTLQYNVSDVDASDILESPLIRLRVNLHFLFNLLPIHLPGSRGWREPIRQW